MVWVKTTDDMPDNHKIRSLSPTAACLYFFGLHRCNSWLTDGWIAKERVIEIFRPYGKKLRIKGAVAELVKQGLWEASGAGFQVHDFEQYQPLAEEVVLAREQSRVRGAKKRERDRATKLAEKRLILERSTAQLEGNSSGQNSRKMDQKADLAETSRRYARKQPEPGPDPKHIKPVPPSSSQVVQPEDPRPDPGQKLPLPHPLRISSELMPENAPQTASEPQDGHEHAKPMSNPAPSTVRGLTRLTEHFPSPSSSTLPSGHLVGHFDAGSTADPDRPLTVAQVTAEVCRSEPGRFPDERSVSERWCDHLRSLARKGLTRRDIKIALAKIQRKTVGESVLGFRNQRRDLGLMVRLLDETLSHRIKAKERQDAQDDLSELRSAERHRNSTIAFEKTEGNIDWIQAAINGEMN